MPNEHGAFKRHILVNEIHKIVFIEIKQNVAGDAIVAEYEAMKRGEYQQFLPDIMRKQITEMVTNGFKIQPFYAHGYANHEYLVLQILGFKETTIFKA